MYILNWERLYKKIMKVRSNYQGVKICKYYEYFLTDTLLTNGCLYTYLAWIFTASSSAFTCHSFSAASLSDWASASFNLRSDIWLRRSDLSVVRPSMATENSPRTACLTSSLSASNLAFVWKNKIQYEIKDKTCEISTFYILVRKSEIIIPQSHWFF